MLSSSVLLELDAYIKAGNDKLFDTLEQLVQMYENRALLSDELISAIETELVMQHRWLKENATIETVSQQHTHTYTQVQYNDDV